MYTNVYIEGIKYVYQCIPWLLPWGVQSVPPCPCVNPNHSWSVPNHLPITSKPSPYMHPPWIQPAPRDTGAPVDAQRNGVTMSLLELLIAAKNQWKTVDSLCVYNWDLKFDLLLFNTYLCFYLSKMYVQCPKFIKSVILTWGGGIICTQLPRFIRVLISIKMDPNLFW